jgi:hypothetical protein
MSNNGMDRNLPVVVIACKVFQGLLEKHIPVEKVSQITWMDYGLHRTPRLLKTSLQQQIDEISQPSLIVLGYGLCGNGLHGLKAGAHHLLAPRTDDCIAVLLGSYETYREEFSRVAGTYYLSKGWLEAGSNPLQEYNEYVTKYGQAQADWLMDQQYRHYRRLLFVAHQPEDFEQYRQQAHEVAKFCERWGMRYEEVSGSDHYIRRLVEVMFNPQKIDSEFVWVEPGGEIRQNQFLRWE